MIRIIAVLKTLDELEGVVEPTEEYLSRHVSLYR